MISVISILSALTEFPVKGSQLSHRCGAAGAPRAVVIVVIIVIVIPIVIVVIVVVAVVVGRAAVIKDVVIAALADIDDKADILAREFSLGKQHRLAVAARALEDEFVAHVFLLDGEFEFELALLRLIFNGGALDALPVFIAGIDVFAFDFLLAVLVFRFVLR